jgi:hypothetical protein
VPHANSLSNGSMRAGFASLNVTGGIYRTAVGNQGRIAYAAA